MDESGSTKEATILDLSEGLNRLLSDQRRKLENHFDRNIPGSGECQEAPQIPNVLDEIIKNLEVAEGQIKGIGDFLNTKVYPKLK